MAFKSSKCLTTFSCPHICRALLHERLSDVAISEKLGMYC